ncbi:MAG: hypothetical protein LBH44_14530 [Treponema sp.]|jgi:hypothetical protein|nr:hypothetical protein [Treponema sp.]
MKNRLLCFFLLSIAFTATNAQGQIGQASQSDEIIVYRLPEPRRVYIYRENNRAIFEASVPAAYIVNKSFVLPENVFLESLTIYQDGKRVHNFTSFPTETVVVLQRGEKPRQMKVIQIDVPDIKPAMPLEISYGVTYGSDSRGLQWDFVLDLEIMNNNNLNCALLARIHTAALPEIERAILAKEPEIILTSAENALLEDAAVLFKLGKMNLAANTQQIIKIEEGSSKYNIVYQWEANRRDRPHAYLRAQTPIKTMAKTAWLTIRSGGMYNFLVSNYSRASIEISPDKPFDILLGEQSNIVTFKSLVTAEFPKAQYPARANLPFTHTFEYHVENKSARTIELEILIPTAIGYEHRTEYTFTTRPPDERPGENLLWKYTMKSGEKIKLLFSYDADFKNPPSYREYDYYEGGR